MDQTTLITIWAQFLGIIVTIVGGAFYFHKTINDEIKIIKANHREDMKATDEKWAKLFARMDDKLVLMDSEWKRLFEKFFEGKQKA